jgi:hypothetical protein
MIKKTKRIIVVAAMMVFGAAFMFAQQSNTNKATFEEVETDVDHFLSTTDWSGVLGGDGGGTFFVFSRFGANIKEGGLDMGFAVNPGNFYLGGYYNGSVVGLGNGDSISETVTVNEEKIKVSAINKTNPHAAYGVLVGLGNLGIKLNYADELAINGNASNGAYTEKYIGSINPSVELGGLGSLAKIRLSVPFVYNREVSTNISGNTITYTTSTLDSDGQPITGGGGGGANKHISPVGNFAEPQI